MISKEDIQQHQLFFETCAKDYGNLGKQLIHQFIQQFDLPPHAGFPLRIINGYQKKPYNQAPRKEMGEWKYHVHGFHCAFTHKTTGQHIEVPLTYGEEFGVLDPYFFSDFILTSPQYQPLPVAIQSLYDDGLRIIQVMEELGKFEKINSNLKHIHGYIVKDRNKKEVVIIEEGISEIDTTP